MRIGTSQYQAPKGLVETESLMGDLSKSAKVRLHEYQQDQLQTRIAFRKAVLRVAGYGHMVDSVI